MRRATSFDLTGNNRSSRSVAGDASLQAFQSAVWFHQQGLLEEAERLYKTQLKVKPKHFESLHSLAIISVQRGDLKGARRQIRKALNRNPNSAEAYNTLGYIMQSLARLDEAASAYRRAITIKPDYATAYNNLGNCLLACKRFEEAVGQYRLAIAKKADFAEAYKNLSGALMALDRYDEAITCSDKALAIEPGLAGAQFNKGVALETIGRLAEARSSFEMAVKLAPRSGRFHKSLAEIKRYQAGDVHLSEMEALARELNSLPEEEQMCLHFALGKAMMDVGQHERAFRHLLDGNALKRGQVYYDERESLALLDQIRSVFTSELMRSRAGEGDTSQLPIFVLGMPRSGTTLVEQILASHPNVYGAGERPDFENAMTSVCASKGKDVTFPDGICTLTAENLRDLGSSYLSTMASTAPDAARITDKLPSNFRFIGLIHLTLSNARIIHVRRDPIDTCISCFTKLFSGELLYTYNLEELGRYYRAYNKLMSHWRKVLPEGAMLEVDYEAVVADVEGQARRLVAYCGLDWHDRCRDFHRTKRPIRTASSTQVRQPIYSSSVGRWRPYRHLLRPLLEIMEIDPAGHPYVDN